MFARRILAMRLSAVETAEDLLAQPEGLAGVFRPAHSLGQVAQFRTRQSPLSIQAIGEPDDHCLIRRWQRLKFPDHFLRCHRDRL